MAVPQLHGQYHGDRSRKETLIEHGFRLPSAADNRPLRYEELLTSGKPVHIHVGDAGRPMRYRSPTRSWSRSCGPRD